MNNKGMLLLLLGVVLAAMLLVTITRPSGTETAATGLPETLVATRPEPVSPQPPAMPTAPSRTEGSSLPAASPVPAGTPQPLLPPAVQPPTPPSLPALAPPRTATASGSAAPVEQRKPSSSGAATVSPAPAPSRPAAPAATQGGQRPAPATTPQNSGNTSANRPTATQAPGSGASSASRTGAAQQTTRPNPPDEAEAKHALKIMALRFSGQGMILRIEADGPFTVKSFVLPNPNRLVVDLAGSWENMRAPMVPENNLVAKARTGRQEKASRLVLDLSRVLKKNEIVRVSPSEVEIHIE